MTEDEFSFLTDIDMQTSHKLLLSLYKNGEIEKVENKNGFVWKYMPLL